MIFFTSDSHLGHSKILDYCNRPFKNVDEMGEALIENWNKVVTQNDIIYHLGDFSFYKDTNKTIHILNRLNGNKILIMGNHDKHMHDSVIKKFNSVHTMYDLYVNDPEAHHGKQLIVLLHYSMNVWNRCHYGSYHLFGHSHGSLPDNPNSLSIDVGVDCHNYTPISYEEVKAIMKRKAFKPLDHHGKTK